MKYTADFINGEKEKLSHDLDMLVGANDVMVDNTILQKFYLLESQKKKYVYLKKRTPAKGYLYSQLQGGLSVIC